MADKGSIVMTTRERLHRLVDELPEEAAQSEVFACLVEQLARELAPTIATITPAAEDDQPLYPAYARIVSEAVKQAIALVSASAAAEVWADDDSTAAIASLSVPVFRRDWDSPADSIYDDES